MFRAILRSQWRESRLAVVLLAGIALVVPLLSLRGAWSVADPWTSWNLLRATAQWGAAYPIIALTAAMVLATAAWWPDNRARHVYALTLPIARGHYILLRYGAGLTLLLAIAAMLALGSCIATARLTLPPLLHAYPAAITVRFFAAGLSAYTLLFALNGLTQRTARILVALFLFLVIATLLGDLVSLGWSPMGAVVDALFSPYSPLSIFRSRWMLIDV